MDEWAVLDGQQAIAENERLNADPSAALPERLSRRCRKTINRRFAALHAKQAVKLAGKALNKVAVLVLIVVVGFSAVFALSEDVRTGVLNFMLAQYADNSAVGYEYSTTFGDVTISVSWLPEGYVLAETGNDRKTAWLAYCKEDPTTHSNRRLNISVFTDTSNNVKIDTENAQVSDVMIQGVDAMLVEKDGNVQLVWGLPDKEMVCVVYGENLDADTAVRFAEGVEIH